MKWTIPNILTLLRILLIPVLVVVFYVPSTWSYQISAVVFGLAAVTDWLDGYLARRWEQTSAFGAFLDPVADKLMVAVALVLLVQDNPSPLFAIPAAIIIGREIVISALREWMAEIGAFFLGTETELVLKSRWVVPTRLLENGFVFDHPELELVGMTRAKVVEL